MSFLGKFLKISLRKQITITVISCCFISALFVYVLIYIFVNEIQTETLKNHNQYYYSSQKEILEGVIVFQNLLFFNYQDFIRKLSYEINIFLETSKYFKEENKILINFYFEEIDNKSVYNNNSVDNNITNTMYYLNTDNEEKGDFEDEELKPLIPILNYLKKFKIPHQGDLELISGFIFYLNKTKRIYSNNRTFLSEFINKEIKDGNYQNYYETLERKVINSCKKIFDKYFDDTEELYKNIFDLEILNLFEQYKIDNDLKKAAYYCPYQDNENNNLFLINIKEFSNEIYITIGIEKDFTDNMFIQLMKLYGITTIISSEENISNYLTCYSLLLKSIIQSYSQDKLTKDKDLKEIYELEYKKLLNKKKITINDCLLNNSSFLSQDTDLFKEKNKFFNNYYLYDSTFFSLSNASTGFHYAVTKYTYPDIFTSTVKMPKYIITQSFEVFTFMNFYIPYSYYINRKKFFFNIEIFICLSAYHLWFIIFLVFFFISIKISKELTDPLIKLKEAIEQMSFKDESIFEYKNDELINELFVMCKKLVKNGKISDVLKEMNSTNNENEQSSNNSFYNNDIEDYTSTVENRIVYNNNLIFNNKRDENDKYQNFHDKGEIVIFVDKIKTKSELADPIKKNKTHKGRTRSKTVNQKREKLTLKGDSSGDILIVDNSKKLSEPMISNKADSSINDQEKKKENKKIDIESEINILNYEMLFEFGELLFSEKKNKTKEQKEENLSESNTSLNENNNQNDSLYSRVDDEEDAESQKMKQELLDNIEAKKEKNMNSMYKWYLEEKNNPNLKFLFFKKKTKDLNLRSEDKYEDKDTQPSQNKRASLNNELMKYNKEKNKINKKDNIDLSKNYKTCKEINKKLKNNKSNDPKQSIRHSIS